MLAGAVVASLPLADLVDLSAERTRLEKELEEALQEAQRAEAQLGNESFVARAPEKVVQTQRDRLTSAQERASTLRARIADLESA